MKGDDPLAAPRDEGKTGMNAHRTAPRRPGRALVAALLGTIAVAALAADAVKLPDPPDGYRWVRYEEGKSAYLRPDGWFVKTEVEGRTASLFISKENIDARGEFETGLTASIIGDFKARIGVVPSRYAAIYISELTRLKPDVVERFEEPAVDGYVGLGVRYRDEEREPAILVHTRVLADDTADVLRLVIFEAPESEWTAAWAHGEKMVKGYVWR